MSGARPRILTVSSSCMNFIMNLIFLPESGEVTAEQKYLYQAGGVGTRAAAALSLLGADSVFCTRLGNDANGARLRNTLTEYRVDTRFVSLDPAVNTAMRVMIREENGNERVIFYPGASRRLIRSDVEDAFTCYPDAAFVQTDLPALSVLAACRYAGEQGIPVFLDAGPVNPELAPEKLENVTVFIASAEDMTAYTGVILSDSERCLRACMSLAQRVSSYYFVVWLAGCGCFLFDGKNHKQFCHPDGKMPDAIREEGARVAFAAALTMAYQKTGDIQYACRFGNSYALAAALKGGRGIAMPTLSEWSQTLSPSLRSELLRGWKEN